ncbi:MAG: ABC transporter substrate-binding protein [Acidimicrobiales bacterium]
MSASMSLSPRDLRLRSLAVIALVGALLVGCSNSSSTPNASPDSTVSTVAPGGGPIDGGVLDIAVATAPVNWAPNAGPWTTADLQAARAVYDRMMVRDLNDQPVPELLSKATPNAVFTEWTLTVRAGITFSDGAPLTAELVAFNLQAQLNDPSNRELLLPIAAITVADAQSVVVSMFTPWSTFPEVLTTRIGTVAAPATLLGFDPRPLGTGPFIWFGVNDAGTTVLVKNPSYWKKGLPHLDGVRFVVIPEAADRVNAVTTGVVGMVAVDEPRQLERLEAIPNGSEKFTIHDDRNAERPKVNVALETGRAPFDRISARRAVAFATDRAEILTKAFVGQGSIARGIVSDTSPWFVDHSSSARDIEQAKKQVAEYTKETGLPLNFTLLVLPGTTLERVASLWRGQLEDVGIGVTIELVDSSTLTFAAALGQFQAILEVGFDSSHPDVYEPLFRGIPAEQPVISSNPTRYINPLVTKAFSDARSTVDITRQLDDYGTLQEQIAIDVPYLFLVQVREVVVTTPKVRDVATWSSGSGATGLGQDNATVSLSQLWIAR